MFQIICLHCKESRGLLKSHRHNRMKTQLEDQSLISIGQRYIKYVCEGQEEVDRKIEKEGEGYGARYHEKECERC